MFLRRKIETVKSFYASISNITPSNFYLQNDLMKELNPCQLQHHYRLPPPYLPCRLNFRTKQPGPLGSGNHISPFASRRKTRQKLLWMPSVLAHFTRRLVPIPLDMCLIQGVASVQIEALSGLNDFDECPNYHWS